MLLSWLVLLHFSNSKHAYTLVSFCLFFYYCCWSWARVYAKFTRWQKFMAPYTSLFSDSIRFSFSLWKLHITWNAEVLKVEYTIDNCAPQLTNSSPSPFCRFFSRRYALLRFVPIGKSVTQNLTKYVPIYTCPKVEWKQPQQNQNENQDDGRRIEVQKKVMLKKHRKRHNELRLKENARNEKKITNK